MVNDIVVNGNDGILNCTSRDGTLVIMKGSLVNHTEYTVTCKLVNGSQPRSQGLLCSCFCDLRCP